MSPFEPARGRALALRDRLELDGCGPSGTRALAELDDDYAGDDQHAAAELEGAWELVEQQPRERDAGDDLEQRDERGQARAEPAAGGDPGAIGEPAVTTPSPRSGSHQVTALSA